MNNRPLLTNYVCSWHPLLADKPSPPLDLAVKDVFKDKCTLTWKEPSSDGGTPITHYVIEMMDMDKRGQWQEVGSFNADQLSRVVSDLQEGKRYKFRVKAGNKIGLSEPVDLSEPVHAQDPWGKLIQLFLAFKVIQ